MIETGFVNGLYRWRNIDVGRYRIHVANWKGLIDACSFAVQR